MGRRLVWGVLVVGLLSACFGSHGRGGGDDGDMTQGGSGLGQGRAGSIAPKPAGSGVGARGAAGSGDEERCDPDVTTSEIPTTNIDKLDLLFVIDNTESMGEEQAALAENFPRLIQRLATGDGFAPAKDIHLGVVSTDMGVVGANGFPGCQVFGDDGIMLSTPNVSIGSCHATYPRFLGYAAGFSSPQETAHDLECIASLGTVGCQLRQPLEAALKALWPKTDPMAENGVNRIKFLPDAMGFGQDGNGDGPNAGFLRNDPAMGLSVIAIVVVSDGDDCSTLDPGSLEPLTANDTTSVDLRCFANPMSLYMLERYVQGYRALREGNPELVVFSVIAGVPPDIVEPDDYAKLDWASGAEREGFYSKVLGDPRMVQTVDPTSQGAKLVPSCNTERGRAYPPRRLVQVARSFGANGSVHSLCGGDMSSAIDGITERIGSRLGADCLLQQPARNMDGLVPCQVEWALPPGPFAPGTPTSCDTPQYPFLRRPFSNRPQVAANGGAICEVAQLRVVDGVTMPTTVVDGTAIIDGWYYDDFSPEVQKGCTGRIAFSPSAKPPTGVKVRLVCDAPGEPPRPCR